MKNTVIIPKNEIVDANPLYSYGGTTLDINTHVRSSVLTDYQKGVKKGNITIIPSDFFFEMGMPILWQNGAMIEKGNIVKILNKEGNSYLKDSNGYDILFRVVGRKLRYDGQVLIDLELQEIVR